MVDLFLRWENVFSIVLGVIAYFAVRKIERKALSEKISRKLQLVQLKRSMDDARISHSDLQEFEDSLLNRRARVRAIEDELVVRDEVHDVEDVGDTQFDMNVHMIHRNAEAENVLVSAERELSSLLGDYGKTCLQESSEAWRDYAEKQAGLAASVVWGGSMSSMIYAGEMERLIIARTADIKDQVNLRRELTQE